MPRARPISALLAGVVLPLTLVGAATASAAGPRPLPDPLNFPGGSIPTVSIAHPATRLEMSQSNNWSGYNQGILEKNKPFQSVSGEWVVPTASAQVRGQNEYSSTWVGIGGGCLDTACTASDATLIQAGTEQDVASNGRAAYYTWYELVPAPSIQTPLAVRPGDLVLVSLTEPAPEVWAITITDRTTRHSWSTTVPYTSDYSTAEWIEETPVVFGTGGAGVGPLPKLSYVHFDLATANGANAHLVPAEAIQLVDSSSHPLATPSAPDANADGFGVCSYARTCPRPGT